MTVCRHCGNEIDRRPNSDRDDQEMWGTAAPPLERMWLVCKPGGPYHEPLIDFSDIIANLQAIQQDLA